MTGLRGKGGGYRLSLPPDQYTVGSILRLTEGSLAPVACLTERAPACPRAPGCRTLPMWQRLDQVLKDFFDSYTIADLMAPGQDGGGAAQS